MDKALFSTGKDDWETPQDLFNELDREFHFNLDPCSTHENCKCERHFTLEEDGLKQDWGGLRFFATLPTPKMENKTSGSRSVTKKAENPVLRLLHLFRLVLIPRDFTSIFTEKQKFALSRVDLNSQMRNPLLRSQV